MNDDRWEMDGRWMDRWYSVSLCVFYSLSVRSALSFQWEELEGRLVSCQHSLACSAANGMAACRAACLSSASYMCGEDGSVPPLFSSLVRTTPAVSLTSL